MKQTALIIAAALALVACKDVEPSVPSAETEAAKAFLVENATKEGVKSLPSGVQYKVVRSGPADGPKPDADDEVKVHYEGTLLDGTVFDSSYQQGAPAVFVAGRLIPAWTEALQQMRPGDEWMLYVPPEQGYGDKGAGPIPPGSVLVFRIELLGVLKRGNVGRG